MGSAGPGAKSVSVSGPQPLTHIPLSPHFFPYSAKAERRPREAEMASTSRCPRPGRSPWGSKAPHHRVWMSGWPNSEGLGMGCPAGASTEGWHGEGGLSIWPWGVRDSEVLGWGRAGGRAFWFPLPLPSFQCLNPPPLPCSAPLSRGSGPQASL